MTVLVLDIGSSSVRALLLDDSAKVLPASTIKLEHHFVTASDGTAVVDAVMLRQRVEQAIDRVLAHDAAGSIRAVGMAMFVGNMLGLDADDQPLTPVYTYADTRSAAQVERLRAALDTETTLQRTGCPVHTAYRPAQLRWLQETRPDLMKQVSQWSDFGTYLYRCWFREAACSYSVASWSGLLNRETLNWDAAWLDTLELSAGKLPPLADYDEGPQGLKDIYAARWPVLRDVRFFLPVGDGAAANIGSGAVDDGSLALTVGTTSALRKISSERLPHVPPGLWSYRITRHLHLIGGATSEGGNIMAWARQTLRLPDDAEAQLMKREPAVHHLTVLPLLAGERSPGYHPDATGTITGLRLSTDPLDILQGALEGVALRLAVIGKTLLKDETKIFASGGAIRQSRVWCQMMANALDHPLHLLEEDETTARGVAMMMLNALDNRQWTDFPPHIQAIVEPIPGHVKLLREALEAQQQLYNRLML